MWGTRIVVSAGEFCGYWMLEALDGRACVGYAKTFGLPSGGASSVGAGVAE